MNALREQKKKSRFLEAVWIPILLLTACLLVFSRRVTASAIGAMTLCYGTLVPVLFPFLVINGILIRCGFPERVGKTMGKPLGRLLGIPPTCVSAVILGLLCGFPTGAAAARGVYQKGLCRRDDLHRTVAISSTPAPAYTIIAVGKGLLGEWRLGLSLWLITVAISWCGAFITAKRTKVAIGPPTFCSPQTPSLLVSVTSALTEAANAMLCICGAVIFFSVCGGLITLLPLPTALSCFFVCVLEMSSGIALCASTLPLPCAFVLIAWALGWSGLSVHAQIASVTEGEPDFPSYFASKLLRATLGALIATALACLGFL